jgi:hypothetical protein
LINCINNSGSAFETKPLDSGLALKSCLTAACFYDSGTLLDILKRNFAWSSESSLSISLKL